MYLLPSQSGCESPDQLQFFWDMAESGKSLIFDTIFIDSISMVV